MSFMGQNALQFVVRDDSNKYEIKSEVERLFEVKVRKVNTHITKKGKIATIWLDKEYQADEIGSRLHTF